MGITSSGKEQQRHRRGVNRVSEGKQIDVPFPDGTLVYNEFTESRPSALEWTSFKDDLEAASLKVGDKVSVTIRGFMNQAENFTVVITEITPTTEAPFHPKGEYLEFKGEIITEEAPPGRE